MAITLKLTHSFESRIVYRTEEVEEVRKDLVVSMRELELRIAKDPRKEYTTALKLIEFLLSEDDEFMITQLSKMAFKNGFNDCLRKDLKDINVTRLSPLRTKVVK